MASILDNIVSQQPDLMSVESVLVTTGKNLNDDVFIKEELWKARSTPLFKPANWEHNSGSEIQCEDDKRVVNDNQTIGVTYGYHLLDKEGNIIDESKIASAEQLPSKFHIVNKDAIYKYLYPKAAAKIAKLAADKKLFVSMECWFKDYDYLVGERVIARNEETAFLDKHLRANGGNGVYKEAKIGRVLRNFTFGGKGFVKKPANVESVILSVGTEEKILAENTIQNTEEVKKMDEEEKKKLEAELAAIKVEAAETKAKLSAIKSLEEKATAAVADLISEENKKKLAAAAIDEYISIFVDCLRETVSVSHTVVESLKKELATSKEELETIKVAAAKAEADKKLADRASKVESELGLAALESDSDEVKKNKADEKAKIMSFASTLSDEAFDSFVTSTKTILKLSAKKVEVKVEDKVETTKASEAEVEKVTASTSILDAVKNIETVPAGRSTATDVTETSKAMSNLVHSLLGITKEEGK